MPRHCWLARLNVLLLVPRHCWLARRTPYPAPLPPHPSPPSTLSVPQEVQYALSDEAQAKAQAVASKAPLSPQSSRTPQQVPVCHHTCHHIVTTRSPHSHHNVPHGHHTVTTNSPHGHLTVTTRSPHCIINSNNDNDNILTHHHRHHQQQQQQQQQ